MTITVEGTLAEDARHGLWGVENAVVTFSLTVGGHCMPFEVRLPIGSSPDDHITAERTAHSMKRGMRAKVVARMLQPVADHGHARFVLRDVVEWRVEAQ